MQTWTADLSVGVEEIDAQHRELFRRLSLLVDAMAAGDALVQTKRLTAFLEVYVLEHFGAEERYMAQYTYPAASAHKVQHEVFLREMATLRARVRENYSAALLVGLHKRIAGWLVNHIGTTDKLLAAFLKSKRAA